MIDLLNTKLELIKKIEELTFNILEIPLEDEEFENSLNKYNELIDKRQNLMNEIDDIDYKINSIDLQLISFNSDFTKSKDLLETNIKFILKNIIDMDKKIKLNTEKELILTKRKINEAEQRLQTSDFELNKEDKKPIGYYLNKKS